MTCLVACWREALLAKAVLAGHTRGYRHHPQLERFRAHHSPLQAINRYLGGLYEEACRRGYAFDRRKVGRKGAGRRIPVTSGQVSLEFSHLKSKVRRRDRRAYRLLRRVATPRLHPLFRMVDGGAEPWEHAAPRR